MINMAKEGIGRLRRDGGAYTIRIPIKIVRDPDFDIRLGEKVYVTMNGDGNLNIRKKYKREYTY